jgi:NAD(P)-dependent dehydrogenase (short-subunit alcohol dehydrogenase family)
MDTDKGVLVYGGAGQLGGTVVSHFKQAGYTTYSVDFRPNEDAHHNFVLTPEVRTKDNTAKVVKGLKDLNASTCRLFTSPPPLHTRMRRNLMDFEILVTPRHCEL